MSNSRLFQITAVSLSMLCALGCSRAVQSARQDKATAAPQEKLAYIEELARFDREQIALAETALNITTNEEVRVFAENLIDDHSQHLEALTSYVQGNLQGPMPGEAAGGAGPDPQWSEAAKKLERHNEQVANEVYETTPELDELESLEGAEFDRKFLDTVRRRQSEAQGMVSTGMDKYDQDAPFAVLLANTGPLLENHIEAAKEVKSRVE